MRLTSAILAILVLCATSGCKRKSGERFSVEHSMPVGGIRAVDINVSDQEPPVVLRWRYGVMEAPEVHTTIPPGSSAHIRIVVVENLQGKCGIYVRRNGLTSTTVLDLHESQSNALRSLVVVQSSPSAVALKKGPQEFLRMEWSETSDPDQKHKTDLFLMFDIGFEPQPTAEKGTGYFSALRPTEKRASNLPEAEK